MSARTMREEDYEYLHRLLSKLWEDQLSDEEFEILEKHLTRYPEARRLYMQYVDLEVELTCLVEAEAGAAEGKSISFTQITRRPTTPVAAAKGKRTGWVLAMAAGLFLVLGLGGFLMTKRAPAPQFATLDATTGQVLVENGQGERISLGVGETLQEGYVLKTPSPGSTAALRYTDGTVVHLWQESVLVNRQDLRKDLWLRSGSMSATVSKQKKKNEMVVRTEFATATVMGTTFSALTNEQRTELSVFEGVVRMKHTTPGKSLDVHQGEYVIIGPEDMQVRNIPQPPEKWMEDFDQPMGKSFEGAGTWNGDEKSQPKDSKGFVQAEKRPVKEDVHYTIATAPTPDGLFVIHPDGNLAFAYRIDAPEKYQILVTTRTFQPDKPPEAVYAYENKDLYGHDVKHRWVQATIPFASFQRISDESLEPPTGDVPVSVEFRSVNAHPQLKLDKIWTSRGGDGGCVIKDVK